MNKNLITKILIIVFTMWISFMWLNNISAVSVCSTTDDATRPIASCTVVWSDAFKCRSNPPSPYEPCWSVGCAPRSTSAEWYNDSCKGDSTCFEWREEAAYDAFKITFGGNIGSYDWVRDIQEKINIVATSWTECPYICEDGRFWQNTIAALTKCVPCEENSTLRPKIINWELKCENWELFGDNWCCGVIECTTAIVATPDKFIAGEDIEISVQFSSILDTISFDEAKNITVDWWAIKAGTMNCATNKFQCQFTVTPAADATEIKITSPEWKANYQWGEDCTATTKTIEENIVCPWELKEEMSIRGGCCMPKNEWSKCDNQFALSALSPDNDLSILANSECDKGDDKRLFCPCDTPPNGESCTEYEGDWVYNDWCCESCWSDEKAEWDECVCSKTEADCAKNDEKLENCKCVCDNTKQCCWIELNTVVPFIGDCIEMTTQNNIADPNDPNTSRVNQLNAFPFLMMGLSKILVTVILIFSFLIVIVAGLMMVTWVYDENNYKKWMERIKKVVVALILLWSSGLILKLINPNFFGW